MNKKILFAMLKFLFLLPRLVINEWEKSNYIIALQVPVSPLCKLNICIVTCHSQFCAWHPCANISKSLNYICLQRMTKLNGNIV